MASDMTELFARDPLKHTREKLLAALVYDHLTGIFTWAATNQGHDKGEVAGSITSYGYISIRIKGRAFLAHRLAWLYMTGDFPKDSLDHIDCDRTNNKFINLREVTPQQNSLNRKKKTEGIRFDGRNKYRKWKAAGWLNNREKYIGVYLTKEEAMTAYEKWRKENIHVRYG